MSPSTRLALKLAFFSAFAWAGACSYPDYSFSNGAGGGAGGQSGSGGLAGEGGQAGSAGAGGSDAADAGDVIDAPSDTEAGASCKPSNDLTLGKAISGTNDPLNATNISKSIGDYSCATKACDGFEATWQFTPTSDATYRFTITSLDADCDLYIVGPGVCDGTCATATSSSTQKISSSETVDVPLLGGKTYFVSVDATATVFCHFELAVIEL